MEACRIGPGQYQLNFGGDTLSPYSIDGMNPIVSSLGSNATYCNVQSVECADHQLCALPQAPPTTRVTVACFDPYGALADVPWNLNMTY